MVAFLAVLVALLVAGAITGILLGGNGEELASRTTTTIKRGDTVVTVTVPPSTDRASTPRRSTTAQFPPLGVDELELRRRDLTGYAVSLPAEWQLVKDDVVESVTPSRRRTQVAARDGEVSLLVDHLVDYRLPPRRNREILDRDYARRKTNYLRVGFDDYKINGRTAFEWRYRYEAASGNTARRVDLIFREGSHDFAVLAAGQASYDDLAALAGAAAETIVVTDRPSVPEPGMYTGIGYQRGERADTTDDYRVQMTFSSTGARIEYPDLACSATLVADGFDGERPVYREEDVTGSCAEGGVWKVRVRSDTAVAVRWTNPDVGHTVSGELRR